MMNGYEYFYCVDIVIIYLIMNVYEYFHCVDIVIICQ